jgi:hypothetical protein
LKLKAKLESSSTRLSFSVVSITQAPAVHHTSFPTEHIPALSTRVASVQPALPYLSHRRLVGSFILVLLYQLHELIVATQVEMKAKLEGR